MSITSNINLAKVNATNLQNNVATQVNNQIARARTTWAPSIATNVADQNAPSNQWGEAYNVANLKSNAYWETNVKVRDINAVNVQDNAANQISDQLANAGSTGGTSTAANTLRQKATNAQDGAAYNKLYVSDYSKYSNVDIKDISALNQQGNAATQVNTQKAVSSTLGWDPATNGAWQTATNWQGGSAYNTINVNV
ncbi:MAG: hypothetical protein O3B01_28390 [Planctomycetota bacterium]|nr:hypothetical protein [Planctomycetota bacterium]